MKKKLKSLWPVMSRALFCSSIFGVEFWIVYPSIDCGVPHELSAIVRRACHGPIGKLVRKLGRTLDLVGCWRMASALALLDFNPVIARRVPMLTCAAPFLISAYWSELTHNEF